jgi:hypothetical protein
MSIKIADKQIERVSIIDDDDDSRSSMEFTIQDLKLTAVPQNDKVGNIDAFFIQLPAIDAVVSDHHLKKKNYFPINGAEVIYKCYEKRIPAVLVTRYEQHNYDIRKFRQRIPVILTPDEFDPDSLIKSFEVCINEFNGKFLNGRKAWRTLIRIDDMDETNFYIIIPAWNQNETVSLSRSLLPEHINRIIQADYRLHAEVNIDAEYSSDLYFVSWEEK